jgi:hypothetical protein
LLVGIAGDLIDERLLQDLKTNQVRFSTGKQNSSGVYRL